MKPAAPVTTMYTMWPLPVLDPEATPGYSSRSMPPTSLVTCGTRGATAHSSS